MMSWVRIVCLLLLVQVARADEVGISEARLIEEAAGVYVLEVDVAPALAGAIQEPLLPNQFGDAPTVERSQVGPVMVIRYRFAGAQALTATDELLLPWNRQGIYLTAYWQDGQTGRAFFGRGPAGILVELEALRPSQLTALEQVRLGGEHALAVLEQHWLVWMLLALAIGFAGDGRRSGQLFLCFIAGHGLSLVLRDVHPVAMHPGVVVALVAVFALLVFRGRLRPNTSTVPLSGFALFLGLLAGSGFQTETEPSRVSAWALNLSLDLVVLALLLLLRFVILLCRNWRPPQAVQVVTFGCGCIVSVALCLQGAMQTPQLRVPDSSPGEAVFMPSAGARSRAPAPRQLTEPLMGFVEISPFEVRSEWLVPLRFLRLSTDSGEPDQHLAVEQQDATKQRVRQLLEERLRVTVDGAQPADVTARADFVTVSAYGVSVRTQPVPEPIAEAALGVSFTYSLAETPAMVRVELKPFPPGLSEIPVSVSDPWGAVSHVLTAEDAVVEWQPRMAGFDRPVIHAIATPPNQWPWLSIGLCLLGGGVFVRRVSPRLAMSCCLLAILVYPFGRFRGPELPGWQPIETTEAVQTVEQLLGNIYRAFDYRNEDSVYDQLAISASGDQLANIYLEHRGGMALEQRGGARAEVDSVDVRSLENLRTDGQGFVADVEWAVSGSVSHFGHTHYRRNRYRAGIQVEPVDGVWKIAAIELQNEEREL